MKKLLITCLTFLLLTFVFSITPAQAAGGIYASGGGTKTAGQNFTITVAASGVTFDSLQGQISVSGPVSIVSFTGGSATWLPGKSPTNGGTFVGITSPTSSITVASITLKGTSPGSGSVSVSGSKLAKSGSIVSTDGGGTSFTIVRAPTPPGGVTVSSSSHPDQNQAYDARTIQLSWNKPSGATGFSFNLDQSSGTTPSAPLSQATSMTYENKDIGTYYFHIRAQNGDGWGPTTHFKITIKEPDPKVDSGLNKASITDIAKGPDFKTNLDDGTLQNFVIKGTVPPGYKANLAFTPSLNIPDGKQLSADSDATTGAFSFTVDFPVKSGFYKVTVQGQKDKTLTPLSDAVKLELGVARGGTLRFITDNDKEAHIANLIFPDYTGPAQRRLVWWLTGTAVVVIAGLGATAWYFFIYRKNKFANTWLNFDKKKK